MNPEISIPRFYSVNEAARILRCSADAIRYVDDWGIVPLMRIAGRRVLTKENIAAIRAYQKTARPGRPPGSKNKKKPVPPAEPTDPDHVPSPR